MATGWASPTKENLNFARLCRLLIDGGTRVLRHVFDTIHLPSTLHAVLHSPTKHILLKGLRARVITAHQWKRLYPRTTPVTSGNFDITLLFVLLRNICNLTPPPTGWDKPPVDSDQTKEADLVRIKLYRNEVYGHITETAVSDADFEKLWTEISAVLIRLGGPNYKPDIERLKVEPMNIDDVKYFIKALEETEKSIKTAIENQGQQVMEKLEDIDEKLGSKEKTIKESEQRVMGKLEDIEGKLGSKEKTIKESEQRVMGKLEDMEGKLDYTRKLKLSIKRQTESLPVLEGQTAISIDDVFTNVTIQRVQNDQEHSKSGREEFDVFQTSSTTLKKCSEMFIWPEKDDPNSRSPITANPKFILLTGKPGIGKSEFCRKMSRDWAKDGILDFRFLFLLTYRQLSLLDHEELDLCDILNRSSLLDEQSMINKGLLQYMIENPEKVLIIFDGYDEYRYRTEITGKLEEKYPNDPCQKMPVPAMIAKIMKGKILRESVVMTSSRPEEAQELKKFPFDVRCEIKGFSQLQVQEYIKNYFKDDKSMEKAVLDHIKMNDILLSFGHIPVMCNLMCYHLKWHMTQSQTTEDLPVTKSELYYEVIKVLITRHSRSSSKDEELTESEVEEILHKLSKFAKSLTKKKKIIFTKEDMMKSLKFKDEEITILKKSGLFDCCPGVKKSPSDKPPLEFSFSHLTLQEFLCAYRFVEKKQLPEKKKTSVVTWMFVAGIMARKKDEKFMKKLIKKVRPKDEYDDRNKVLPLHCLYEYRDDELSKRVINKLHDKYCDSDGRISFVRVNDLDCLAIGYLLYIVQLLTEKQTTKHLTSTQSFIVNTLYIGESSLSPSGVSVLCKSLSNSTFVTRLKLCDCELDDECVKIIAQTVNKTRINDLNLAYNNVTDKGVMCLCDVVSKRDCPVEVLDLLVNRKITDECKRSVRKLLQQNKPYVKLWIMHEKPIVKTPETQQEPLCK